MSYHIIIQQERRTPVVTEMGEDRSRLAIPITSTLPTEQPDTYLAGETMLHHMGSLPENIDDPQYVMVAEWDGVSPYVIQHKGDYAARNMEFSGWPLITKEQYDAIPAPDPVV